ncbi:hypothetical protein EYF80_009187 [Liparis tanakae]|uniref:Uncharacterized protein n=1 Tax=Liparis tanakae TaxID=230148 RepID=A0A4Z2IS74_9TELE|nr:hypothetical protein EYF80_009187 [Liparis tanakae]
MCNEEEEAELARLAFAERYQLPLRTSHYTSFTLGWNSLGRNEPTGCGRFGVEDYGEADRHV